MRKQLEQLIDQLDEFPARVKQAIRSTKSEEELVDVVGAVKAIERRYKPDIRLAVSEMGPPDGGGSLRGERHTMEPKRRAVRSYNVPNLMRKFQDAGVTLFDLIDMGVVSLSWNWTALSRVAKHRGVELIVVDREVPMMGAKVKGDVGEVWQPDYPKWS